MAEAPHVERAAPGRQPGALRGRARVRAPAGRRSPSVAALGAVADDGGAPARPARPDRGRPRSGAFPAPVLVRRGAGHDGAALPYGGRPLHAYPWRSDRSRGMGIPGRARRRRAAPHPSRGMAEPRALRLPHARHPLRRAARTDYRRLPRARVGSTGVRRGRRVHPHPSGPSRRGGRGLRRPALRASQQQAGPNRPRRSARPRRHVAGRRRRGVPAHRSGRRRGAGGDPQAQRVPLLPRLRPLAAVPRPRRLAREPDPARAAPPHRPATGRRAAHPALRRPGLRPSPGHAARRDDVPGARVRRAAPRAGVLLGGTVRAVRRTDSVSGAGRLCEPRPEPRLRLGPRGVSGRHGPARSGDGGGTDRPRGGVPGGGGGDARPARNALARLPARADGGVGVSPEGARGARVRDPEQAGRGEEAWPVHPPAPARVGARRGLRRDRGESAGAAPVQERQVVRRPADLDETARHVGGEPGLPAGAGPRRGGEDQAVPQLGRPAAILHGRLGVVRAGRPSPCLRRVRRLDGGRAR